MGSRIIVSGTVYRGEYPFDYDEALSALEWSWVKKLSGYLPLTFDEGLRGGDPELIVALAVIAIYRSGKLSKHDVLTAAERLMEVPFDGEAIRFVMEDTADPPEMPAETPANGKPSSITGGSSRPTSDEAPGPTLATTGALS